MTVSIVGSGTAVDSVVQALSGEIDSIRQYEAVEDVESSTLSVVVGTVGASCFERANSQFDGRWIALELGGVGGVALEDVDVAVSGFGPETPCFDCLCTRVAAQREDSDEDDSPTVSRPTAHFAGALAGRETLGVYAGDGDILGTVVELPHAVRELLTVPGCSCTDHQRWSLSDARTDRTLEDSLDRAERAVDPRIGIVSEVGELESFPLPYYLAQLGRTTAFSSQQASQQAAGVGLDWNEAFMKALGESLERYSAGVYDRDTLPVGRPADRPRAVDPAAFVRPDEPDRSRPIEWVPGTNLETGAQVELPASRVFFPFQGDGPTITTGLGLGNDHTEAMIAGLTEIVERDAAILGWYSSYEPLGLSITDETFETLRRRARTEGLSVTATLLTQDIDVPVVAVAVHRSADEWPAFALGLAAALDPVDAAISAGTEALQNFLELQRMGRTRATESGGRIGHFASRPATVSAFTEPSQSVPIGSVRPALDASTSSLDALVERVSGAGLSVYASGLTPVDVRSLGFEAVRVVVPGAQPLFIDTPYFGDRASAAPETLGFEPRLQREHHPYP